MRSSNILLLEDDQVDVMTIKEVLREAKITSRLDVVSNGEEALTFLENPENEKPGIILLDLNMPKMNGLEFLQIAKKDDRLKEIPVVVLTISKEDQDMVDSFNLGVAGYMIKPVDSWGIADVTRLLFEVAPEIRPMR
ncbi:MAG: response regulator [Deltaproteobacteria bacterium]|nr:response regulator [Candidatus Tharpella aukensis]